MLGALTPGEAALAGSIRLPGGGHPLTRSNITYADSAGQPFTLRPLMREELQPLQLDQPRQAPDAEKLADALHVNGRAPRPLNLLRISRAILEHLLQAGEASAPLKDGMTAGERALANSLTGQLDQLGVAGQGPPFTRSAVSYAGLSASYTLRPLTRADLKPLRDEARLSREEGDRWVRSLFAGPVPPEVEQGAWRSELGPIAGAIVNHLAREIG